MFLPDGLNNNLLTRSAVASTFVASLELAKEGYIELKQNNTFGPIFVRPEVCEMSQVEERVIEKLPEEKNP